MKNVIQENPEIWKTIEDFPDYEISDRGRVRNKKTNSIMIPGISKQGYLHVGLRKNGVRKNVYIHRLVASSFLGKNDDLVVNHKDGNKSNNSLENLEWCTDSENIKHAYITGLKKPSENHPLKKSIQIIETGEKFPSIHKCAKAINGDRKSINECLKGNQETHKELHFKLDDEKYPSEFDAGPFLKDYQMDAVYKMFSGSILNGGVGSGKSRTGLYFYFKEQGGSIEDREYIPMINPKDLYIITTAMKRDSMEWEGELANFHISLDKEVTRYKNLNVVIDSWNNIKKYTNVHNAFFIFDEDRVCGSGAWVKAFYKIAEQNEWIILSATPGDTWKDYIPVFVANGFYRNKTEFEREHVVWARYSKFPQIDRYVNVRRLIRLRNKILIDMDFTRSTIPHHEDIYVQYDITKYKRAMKDRWDPYKNEPIQQASGLCYVLRRIVNEDESRVMALLELIERSPKSIVFYNFDYEREMLLHVLSEFTVDDEFYDIAEWSGHAHQPIPDSKRWVYLVQYTAGCEGWNCIKTDTIIFYSQNYSYKIMEQASGRINRMNTPFLDLYYYHLKSRSGIDLAISKALNEKKKFNENRWIGDKF